MGLTRYKTTIFYIYINHNRAVEVELSAHQNTQHIGVGLRILQKKLAC